MATAMLNVRMDKSLKVGGERVLAQQGISATEAVRALYRFIEQNDAVPDFCKADDGRLSSEEKRRRMRQLVGVAKLSPGEDSKTLKRERLSKLEF